MTYKVVDKITYKDGTTEEYLHNVEEYDLKDAKYIANLCNIYSIWHTYDSMMGIKREHIYKTVDECKDMTTDPSIKFKMLWNKMIEEKEENKNV